MRRTETVAKPRVLRNFARQRGPAAAHPHVWAHGVVAPALESCPGRDSICLDLRLNLNPDRRPPSPLPTLPSPSSLPPSSSFLVLSRRAPAAGAVPQPSAAGRAPPPTRPVPAAARNWPRPGAEGTAGIVSSGPSERVRLPRSRHLKDMEVKDPGGRRGAER